MIRGRREEANDATTKDLVKFGETVVTPERLRINVLENHGQLILHVIDRELTLAIVDFNSSDFGKREATIGCFEKITFLNDGEVINTADDHIQLNYNNTRFSQVLVSKKTAVVFGEDKIKGLLLSNQQRLKTAPSPTSNTDAMFGDLFTVADLMTLDYHLS